MDVDGGEPSPKRAKTTAVDSVDEETEEGVYTLCDARWCSNTFGGLLDKTSTHDVTFKTSDGGSVSGHRLIVAAGSPVFHAMLYGNMKESNEKEIELPSVDANTLQNLLEFVYTGHVTTTADDFIDLLQAARYFNVVDLERKCTDTIGNSLTPLTYYKTITLAMQQQFSGLLEQCHLYIQKNITDVVKTSEFKCLSPESMIAILSSSNLDIKEINLFLALKEWLNQQEQSVAEDTIKNMFQLIRYPLICAIDLIKTVGPTGLADPDLYKAALEYHLSPGDFKGPQNQIEIRKYYFDFRAAPAGMQIEHSARGTIITKVEGKAHTCTTKIYPTKFSPIKINFCLMKTCNMNMPRYYMDTENIKLQLGYTTPAKSFVNIDLFSDEFPLREEVVADITMEDDKFHLKVGSSIQSIAVRKHLLLAVIMKKTNGQLIIRKL